MWFDLLSHIVSPSCKRCQKDVGGMTPASGREGTEAELTFILVMSLSRRVMVFWKPEASRTMRSSLSLIWCIRDLFWGVERARGTITKWEKE